MSNTDAFVLLCLMIWAGLMTALGPAATLTASLGFFAYCVLLICEAIKQR